MITNGKKITQKEIAQLAGVCQAAVSSVLSNPHSCSSKVSRAIHEKILRIARENNYFPNMQARGLRGCKSHLVGVLLNTQISQRFYDILGPLEREIFKTHRRLIMGQLGQNLADNEKVLEDFSNLNLDGIIVFYHEMDDAKRLFKKFQPFLPKLVFLDKPPADVFASYVKLDFTAGIRKLIKEIYSLGSRRIGLCLNDSVHYSMVDRLQGYREGLAAVGLPYDDALFIAGDHPDVANIRFSSITNAMADKLLKANADAILCSNDAWASAMLESLNKRGIRVPEDIKLAGYDNTKNICLSSIPRLSSVKQGDEEIAIKLTRLLDAPTGTVEIVQPTPVMRESCGVHSSDSENLIE